MTRRRAFLQRRLVAAVPPARGESRFGEASDRDARIGTRAATRGDRGALVSASVGSPCRRRVLFPLLAGAFLSDEGLPRQGSAWRRVLVLLPLFCPHTQDLHLQRSSPPFPSPPPSPSPSRRTSTPPERRGRTLAPRPPCLPHSGERFVAIHRAATPPRDGLPPASCIPHSPPLSSSWRVPPLLHSLAFLCFPCRRRLPATFDPFMRTSRGSLGVPIRAGFERKAG